MSKKIDEDTELALRRLHERNKRKRNVEWVFNETGLLEGPNWWWCSICSQHQKPNPQNCRRCRAGSWVCKKHNNIDCNCD